MTGAAQATPRPSYEPARPNLVGVYETPRWFVSIEPYGDEFYIEFYAKDGGESEAGVLCYWAVGRVRGDVFEYSYEGRSTGRAKLVRTGDEWAGEVTLSPSRRVR